MPFKGRSSSASSFYASVLQAISGVMSLALCPQVVSQAPQHFRSSKKQAICEVLHCPPVYLLGHFPSLRHIQGSIPTGVFEGGCGPLTHSSLGFSFHFYAFPHCSYHQAVVVIIIYLSLHSPLRLVLTELSGSTGRKAILIS